MATQEATLTEQVFVSRHTNLTVTRFGELTDIQNGLQRKVAPGLRYEFGRDSGVLDSHGFDIPVGGSIRVDDALRVRDEQYIARYGKHYPPETDCDPYNPDEERLPDFLGRAFLPTEEFLRRRAAVTGDFRELPAVAPESGVALREITALVIEDDVEGLLALYEREDDEWRRPDVLEAAQEALSKLAEKAEREAQPPAA